MGRSVDDTLNDPQIEQLLNKPKNFKKNKLKGDDNPRGDRKIDNGKEGTVMGDISNTKRALGI